MIEKIDQKNSKTTLLYFLLSTAITWWFIEASPVYDSLSQKLLSCGIAGAKWTIQLIAALLFLQNKKWEFIRRIGFTCLLGSIILLPFCFSSALGISNNSTFFLGSLIVSVGSMVISYRRSVEKSDIGIHWWSGWLFCLAVAIILQLKVVFNLSLFQ